MKKSATRILLLFGLLGAISTLNYSCKTGEGCDTAKFNAKSDKDGNLTTKRGKSGLFSKKQKKRMAK